MPCLSDLVVERRNTSNAPYSQNEQQKESSFLKEFYAYQKKQMEELAAYSETSATDINKAKIAGRYLLQPAANVNLFKSGEAELQTATPSSSKDVSYADLKTQNIELSQPQYDLKTQNIKLSQPQYDLKTANITLTDTSDIYKALSTHTVPESEYSFSKLYGNLTTLSNSDLFKNGEGFYSNWHTSPISYTTNDGITERLLAEKSNVPLYDVIASNQYGSKYDYYSLAYDNRSIMAAVGLTDNIYNSASYNYENLIKEAIKLSSVSGGTVVDNGIVYPQVPINGFPTYQPMQLIDDMWNLYNNSKLTTEANLSSVGIYNPVGAWEDDEQAFLHRIPLLGDLQQRVSDLEGSSILWQAFYNKKSSDPSQIYKIANVNTNVRWMTGRFVPQPPIINEVRFTTSDISAFVGRDIENPFSNILGYIPSYPYIPLPSAKNFFNQKVLALKWDVQALAQPETSHYLPEWKPLGDLQSREKYFGKEATDSNVPSYYLSEFGYEKIKDFEGHVTTYDLRIEKPQNAPAELPSFACNEEGFLKGRSLAYFTNITAIPDAELKNNNTYQLGEFGSFLLSMNYQNYVSTIQTKTLETAECDCYQWGKAFIEYFYGSSEPIKYRHRSLYKSYYNIVISKIYYMSENISKPHPIKRVIEEKTFFGVPSFNLTEPVQDNRLQEITITWNIIGQDSVVKQEQYIDNATKGTLAGISMNLETSAIA